MFLRSRTLERLTKEKRHKEQSHISPAALGHLDVISPTGSPRPQTPDWPNELDHRPIHSSGDRSTLASFKASSTFLHKKSSNHTFRSPSYGASQSAETVTPHDPAGAQITSMSSDRTRSRRERTFVGSVCAVCEEPLEHTLRGERILQFSCTHVSHEACFYEFIRDFESQYCPTCNAPLHLDTSRGGNVLDIEKITNMVRSASANDNRSNAETPTPAWDEPVARPPSRGINPRPTGNTSSSGASVGNNHHSNSHRSSSHRSNGYNGNTNHNSGYYSNGELRDNATTRSSYREPEREPSRDRYLHPESRHGRSDSEATGIASSGGYPETTQSGGPRRAHDYDVQAMETTVASPRAITRNPIPVPTVTVRSEFPTITRSRQQQTLTCLITIEVPECTWRADPEDLQPGQPAASHMPPPHGGAANEGFGNHQSPVRTTTPRFVPYESPEVLEMMTENLRGRVDNWHGLDFGRFGKLRLYGTLRVGKDKASWQELECFLFAEMLICVKEKKHSASSSAAQQQQQQQQWEDANGGGSSGPPRKTTRCTLKGSILIKKHLNEVSETGAVGENILTLNLSVAELPQFHLRFDNRNQLKLWQQALLDLNAIETSPVRSPDYDRGEFSETEEEEWQQRTPGTGRPHRVASVASSYGGNKSVTTAATEYTNYNKSPNVSSPTASVHVPIDIVVVVPISSSMQGVKTNLVRDALRFMVQTLGERDRMGLVTFGSGSGGVPVVGMTTKSWPGWNSVLASIKPVGQKSHRADVVEGANVAMDLLMQRKYNNPIATIMLISDASTSDVDSVDFVVSRAEAAKITIHSFGLGMTHKPDTMIELSTRTKASYTYVKDWMMLRECLAGCVGAMQAMSHQNVKLRLKLPEGSPAKFHKISGALQITKRATGRDAEALLGDLRFGDKRDILVQLVIVPDNASQEQLPQDAWETIVSGLEALGGPVDQDEPRTVSVEEVPLIQADLSWGDILRDGTVVHMPRPSLLAITMLPSTSQHKSRSWQNTPPIPPHPSIVQRRMELLTSDMLTRALTLVSRGQHERAHTLLNETRSILKGLGKGGLPPVPPLPSSSKNGGYSGPTTPHTMRDGSPIMPTGTPDRKHTPSPTASTMSAAAAGFPMSNAMPVRTRSNDALGSSMTNTAGIDAKTVAALDNELEASLEWINHPAVFGRDSRKAVLQAIGVISSQRAFTFRTPIESLWASRVASIKRLTEKSREWREEGGGECGIMEEA